MKKLLMLIFILRLSFSCDAQSTTGSFDFSFLGDFGDMGLYLDTTNPDNIWQIGAPQKTVFDSAYSAPTVIVTDTVNTYPVNDTSAFVFWQLALDGWAQPMLTGLTGFYWVNSDTLNDYGTIEISIDKGANWIDILTDTTYDFFGPSIFSFPVQRPVLSGNSYGWKQFGISFEKLSLAAQLNFCDTVLVRFSFVSDSIDNHKDGLMFDNFSSYDFAEGIASPKRLEVSSMVFPNPTTGFLTIDISNKSFKQISVCIRDIQGKAIVTQQFKNNQQISLDLRRLPAGSYYYELSSVAEHLYSKGKFDIISE